MYKVKFWQFIYLVLVGIGFWVGWNFSPRVALLFIWVFVIVYEIICTMAKHSDFESDFPDFGCNED